MIFTISEEITTQCKPTVSNHFLLKFTAYITYFMETMSELVQVELAPEDITDGFCTQHGISSHSTNHCNEQQQLCSSRQEGEMLE